MSFLAGEGTGLAIAEAYVLAGELFCAQGDYRRAFEGYEARLRPYVDERGKGRCSRPAGGGSCTAVTMKIKAKDQLAGHGEALRRLGKS